MPVSRRQSGAAAVEFALVLPLFLFMMYGMVVYAYMFVLQQSITFAAQAAAEATVKVDPALGGGYQAAVISEARNRAAEILDYLPDNQKARVLGENGDSVQVTFPQADIVKVELTFNFTGLFPVLDLPGLGAVPPMPDVLYSSASAGI